MADRPVKLPGPDHPIRIGSHPSRVTVSVAGHRVADSRSALVLQEASYPPVTYLPRRDVDFSQLERSTHRTYCPYKGDCSYYSIPAGGPRSRNAVWSYENPHPAVSEIANYMAFYPDRVDAIEG